MESRESKLSPQSWFVLRASSGQRSNRAASTRRPSEDFLLPSADQLHADTDVIFQQDFADALPDHGTPVLDWPVNYCEDTSNNNNNNNAEELLSEQPATDWCQRSPDQGLSAAHVHTEINQHFNEIQFIQMHQYFNVNRVLFKSPKWKKLKILFYFIKASGDG